MYDITPLKYNEKDKKVCPNCNSYIPKASEYCPFCGAYLKNLKLDFVVEATKGSVQNQKKSNWNKHIIAVLTFAVIILALYVNVFLLLSEPSSKVILILIAVLGVSAIAYLNYAKRTVDMNQGKVQIPFGSDSIEGESANDVYKKLIAVGFENIATEPDDTGWLGSGMVTRVTINGTDKFSEKEYSDSNADIVIYYSSENRIDAGKILKDWQNISYNILLSKLRYAGFTDVSIVEDSTFDREKNKKITAITLNGRLYMDEECYLSPDASIKISYNILMIYIGREKADFEDKYYKDVETNLRECGFTNITLKRANNLKFGVLKKEGKINSLSIDGNLMFKKDDVFYYDVPIEIVVNTFENRGCDDIVECAY